jgi:hypothetical protein
MDGSLHMLPRMLLQGSPSTMDTVTWVAMGIATIATLFVLSSARRKKNKDPIDKPFTTGNLAQQRAVERQMQNLLVELSEMSRQITAQLDTRASKLETLLHEADQRIAQLHGGGAVRAPAPFEEPRSTIEPTVDPDPRHVAVYELADRGQDAASIAAELGRPSGEIELILALRQREPVPSSSGS